MVKLRGIVLQRNIVKEYPLVSVVILTFNRTELVKKCLDSLYKQTYQNKEIIVIDNGSIDRTLNFLKEQRALGKIQLVINKKNLGSCFPRNQGIIKSKGEYILFIDSDVVLIDESTITIAVEEMDGDKSLGQLGGIGYTDEQLTILQHGLLKLTRGFEIETTLVKEIPSATYYGVDYVQSDFVMVRRTAIDKVKGFDPFYFYYPEDADLSIRMIKNGYKIGISPRIKYCHYFLPRRSSLNHHFFHKVLYYYIKNYSVLRVFEYYKCFLKNGFQTIKNKSRIIKKLFLLCWYLESPVFFIWIILFSPLIKLQNKIDFLAEVNKKNHSASLFRYILSIPMRIEDAFLGKCSSFLFWIKKKRHKRGLYLFVTNRCNYTCSHCFLGDETMKNQNILSVEEIKKIGLSLKGRIGGISLTGGEPFLRNDIVEICNVFQLLSGVKSFSINTNGFNPSLIAKQIKKILQNDTKKQKYTVIVSLDGLQEIHDKLRMKEGAFQNAVETIESIKRLQNEYNNLKVQAQVTITEGSYKDFYKLFNFVTNQLKVNLSVNWYRDGSAFGVDPQLIFPPRYESVSSSSRLPSLEQCEEIFEFLLENRWQDLQSNLINKYTLEIIKDRERQFPCVAPEMNLVVYANGDFSFCELVKPFFNLRKENFEIERLINSKKWKQMTNAVSKCFCIHPCIMPISMQNKHFIDLKIESLREFQQIA